MYANPNSLLKLAVQDKEGIPPDRKQNNPSW